MKKLLCWSSALLSYVLCMCLPMVGRSGSKVPWAKANATLFLLLLLLAIAACAAGLYLAPRKRNPWYALLGAQLFFFLAFILGWLKL